MIRTVALIAGVALLLGGASMRAHHSVSAEFDTTKPISFTGKVKQIEWTNPHIYTQIETTDENGQPIVYRVEGGAPNSLYRQGWRKDTLKIGEVVTVNGIRAKRAESRNIGSAVITTADGRRMFSGSGQARVAAPQ